MFSTSRRRLMEVQKVNKLEPSVLDVLDEKTDGQRMWDREVADGSLPASAGDIEAISLSQDEADFGLETMDSVKVIHETTKMDSVGFMQSLSVTSIAGAVACGLLLAVILLTLILWLRSRRRRQKLLHELTCEDGADYLTGKTKSCPASRSPSPKLNKRSSCPDMKPSSPHKGVMLRTVTIDGVPDFTLPPERVQPRLWSSSESSGDYSSQHGMSPGGTKQDLHQAHQSPSEDEEPYILDTAQGGRLSYSLIYDQTSELLHVTLVKVKDLPGRGNNQPRDPFVKMFLLPDERTCRVSMVKKKTLNPIYNETCTFFVPKCSISERALRFSVYDVDKRRVRHCLGHVVVNLKDADLSKGEIMAEDLESTVQAMSTLGDLQVSLLYLPATEKVKVGLHRARNLSRMCHYPDNLGAYVRIQLYYGHKCHRIKRTLAVAVGSEITFNESLSFRIHSRQFDSCNIVISLMLTYPRPTGSSLVVNSRGAGDVTGETDVEYGRIVMGPFMYARGDKLAQWQEMLTQPKTATTRWHDLTSINSPITPKSSSSSSS